MPYSPLIFQRYKICPFLKYSCITATFCNGKCISILLYKKKIKYYLFLLFVFISLKNFNWFSFVLLILADSPIELFRNTWADLSWDSGGTSPKNSYKLSLKLHCKGKPYQSSGYRDLSLQKKKNLYIIGFTLFAEDKCSEKNLIKRTPFS